MMRFKKLHLIILRKAQCGKQRTILGEVIKTGDVKQVQGEGMPYYRNPFEKGRLLIQFNVVFPANLEPSMAEALSKILPPV